MPEGLKPNKKATIPIATIAKSPFVEEPISIAATVHSKPKGVIPEELMKVWRIDRDAADQTLNCTT